MKGKFITIYGINNIGKSTHVQLLCKHLEAQGHKCIALKYPITDIEPSGKYLNNIIRGKKQKISEAELQLWFVINRFQFQPTLEKYLEDGYTVIAEDYCGTGIAWGMAKGLEEDWLIKTNAPLRREDFAIMLEGERSLHAVEEGHIHEKNSELIEKSLAAHSHLAEKFGWERVKIQKRKEDTSKLVCKLVDEYLAQG